MKIAMCGRFSLTATPDEIAEFFALLELDKFPERYNIAPTQPVMVIIEGGQKQAGSNLPNRQAMLVRWGFTPTWVKDPKEFPLLTNARSETAMEKASFKNAMRHRRVLIPASGFYEWKRPPKGSKEKSQAYWVRPKHGKIVAFAGLMETWSSSDGSEVDTAAILTAAANNTLSPVHHRMPVVIKPEDFEQWLDCKTQEPRHVADLMKPIEDDFFEVIPVSNAVNKVANMGPDLQTALTPEQVAFARTPDPVQKKVKVEKPKNTGQMDLF
tara:strand:+ start:970 stop:1776 length:807 start_codon:yes stop_codon:yes gene_type:complete